MPEQHAPYQYAAELTGQTFKATGTTQIARKVERPRTLAYIPDGIKQKVLRCVASAWAHPPESTLYVNKQARTVPRKRDTTRGERRVVSVHIAGSDEVDPWGTASTCHGARQYEAHGGNTSVGISCKITLRVSG